MVEHVILSATKNLSPAVVQPLELPLPNLLYLLASTLKPGYTDHCW